jgi:hypothetical protein
VPSKKRKRPYKATTLDTNADKQERVRLYFQHNRGASGQSNHFIAALIKVGEKMVRRWRDDNGVPQLPAPAPKPKPVEPPKSVTKKRPKKA